MDVTDPDLLIYLVHACFWTSFGITRSVAARTPDHFAESAAPTASADATAPHSRSLLALHMLTFGIMYFGVGNAVLPDRVPDWFAGQRIAGGLVIAAGAALMNWALLWFRSWWFRAQLQSGLELASGGPFHLVRLPSYPGLDLLALGTATSPPTPAPRSFRPSPR